MSAVHSDVLARALLRTTRAALGRKICLTAVMRPMMAELRASIPENGVGEEISERRNALQYLESTCRLCPHTAKCWKAGAVGS